MEDLRTSSRRPSKPSYGDIFGGSPKLSAAPFPSKTDDYAQMFGGVAESCSIPFLDLPQPEECGSFVNYSEIFGGFSGGDVAAEYKELVGEEEKKKKKRAVESSAVASNESNQKTDLEVDQDKEVSDPSFEGANQGYGPFSDESNFSSSFMHSDGGSKLYSMLYQRTSHDNIEGVAGGKTHIVKLHAVPGFTTHMINSCSAGCGRSDEAPHIQTNDLAHNSSFNGQLCNLEQLAVDPSISSNDTTVNYGEDLRTHKNYSTKHAASLDEPENPQHCSHSADNYSASGQGMPYSHIRHASLPDINLRTEPSKVPPPSREPPKLVSKQDNTKSHQTQYKIGTPQCIGLKGFAKDGSFSFIDVEVDASSAAEAMKRAVEQAQARLKRAKELMERKQGNFLSHKKLGHKEGAKYDERDGINTIQDKNFSEVTAKKPLLKKDRGAKEYALGDKQNVIKVCKVAQNHEEKEQYVVTAEQSQQLMSKENEFQSSHMYYSSEGISGEWKTEETFFELINNIRKEDIGEEPRATNIWEGTQNYFEKPELHIEFNTTVEIQKVNDSMSNDKIESNSKAYNVTQKEKIDKIDENFPDICILKENKHDVLYSSSRLYGNEKLQAVQEVVTCEEPKKTVANENTSSEKNKMNMESSNNAFNQEGICLEFEENRNLDAAKEVCEHVGKEKESSGAYESFAIHETVEELKMFRSTDAQQKNEIEMEVCTEACVEETEEEVVVEVYGDENFEFTLGNGELGSCEEDNQRNLEGSRPDIMHEERGKLNGAQGVCMPGENNLKSKEAPNGNEVRENPEELKPVQVTQTEMNSAKDIFCPDHKGTDTREAQLNGEKMPFVVENTMGQRASRGDLSEREKAMVHEGNEAHGPEQTEDQSDADQEILQKEAKLDIVEDKHKSMANNDTGDTTQEGCQKTPCSSYDQKINSKTLATDNYSPGLCGSGSPQSEKNIKCERDHEREQVRKLDEEKEKEREREKDRLAVERATLAARERAVLEARERAERIAVERVTAEARQRALAEAREKAEKASAEARQRALTEAREKEEKASAEALEKLLAEKAMREAKLRAERAAVERATAEARERAVEKARQHAERLSTASQSRKGNEGGYCFRASEMEDRETKLQTSSEIPCDVRFQSVGSSGSSRRNADSSGDAESPLRCKARLERHQRTFERATKALAEKNVRDILAQREQAEKDRLAELLDTDVRRWSLGKEGNLRALLSTLQYILGPESGWQPIPLTDVITAAAVKKAYRKATLCVHPDKLQQRGANIQQKYICEKVFDLLKDAWNKFNSEER